MRLLKTAAAGAVISCLVPLATMAEGDAEAAKIYPYHSSENFCPEGLEPVAYAGEVSCGEPNQTITYRQVMSHPSGVRSGRNTCPVGTKGCTFD